jgi:type I restriction enzyme R subunit
MPCVDKVLFVVDRKDLDYQTMKEYNKFEEGAVNSNTSTAILAKQLNASECHIIVTTIQKLSNFVRKNTSSAVYDSHIVVIFDECHRSQFGKMRKAITRQFKNYHLFGFTGTPIFPENAPSGKELTYRTTAQAFGDCLHTYTVVDAIRDGNVLPFRIDYLNTVQESSKIKNEKVYDIDRETALLSPQRIEHICSYVLDHFNQKTMRSKAYLLKNGKDTQHVMGFNSIFAAQSIPAAKVYYSTFKRLIEQSGRQLKIAIIYSWAPNEASSEEDQAGFIDDESFDAQKLNSSDRDFLDGAIRDYNATFHTSFSMDNDSFENYYKDISDRMKHRELDMLIVVNMFLTGFDAKTLNTLWVDKNLRMHGLIQAFSRTNRILNSVKTFGNIVCFRNLRKQVDTAIGLFGDPDAGGIVLLKPYEEYLRDYNERVAKLAHSWQPGKMPVGESAEKDYIQMWGAILRLRNILTAWDRFVSDDALSPRDVQDYSSVYLSLWQKYRSLDKADKEEIIDDLTFEIELVKQVEVNIDYILMLVEKYHKDNCANKEVLENIDRAVSSSPQLRDKKDLIDDFVASLTVDSHPEQDWGRFIAERREAELNHIIKDERLKPDKTQKFMADAFRDGGIQEDGIAITKILPPTSRFSKNNNYDLLKWRVIKRLRTFFSRFEGM